MYIHVDPMNNPTYEEGVLLENNKRDGPSPIYSDVGEKPTTINAITNQTYEGLYSETVPVDGAMYENTNAKSPVPQDYLVPDTNQRKDHSRVSHNGTQGGTITADAMDNKYSALGPVEYFTLEPHIPNRPVEQQLPPANDDYSQLHHL